MKIHLLRHEQRDIKNPLFFSELTKTGIGNSIILADLISKLSVNNIYTSPFLRVLQTVHPYLLTCNKVINIEYGLYELLEDPLFNETNWKHTYNDLPNKYLKYINQDYKSIIDLNSIKLNESFEELCISVKPFIEYLISQNEDVFIVSHMSTCNSILHYFNSDINKLSNFDMGEFKTIEI